MRKVTITRPVLVQTRLSIRERDRWREAAAAYDLTLAELVRESVRARLLLLEQRRPLEAAR